MVRILEFILMIFVLPIIFLRNDVFGENLKSKNRMLKSLFLKFYLSDKFLKFKKTVKIGDIKRKNINIDKFLTTDNIKDISVSTTPHFKYSNLQWSDEQKKMREEIIEGKYKEGLNTHIQITRDNIVIDGNHRVCILKEKYGDNYEILVVKNYGWKWEKIAKTNLLITYLMITQNTNKPSSTSQFNFVKDIIKEFKIKGNQQFKNEEGELTSDGCKLLIHYWNILFPTNKINIGG